MPSWLLRKPTSQNPATGNLASPSDESTVPVDAKGQPTTKLLRAPKDWGDLAHDEAYLISQRATQLAELHNHSIFVQEPKSPTPFATALRKFMQSSLSEMGVSVAEHAGDNALNMDVDVQSVKLASGLQVVVSTSISNGKVYLFRSTEVYAVNRADVRLYDASLLPQVLPPSQTKTINVTSQM